MTTMTEKQFQASVVQCAVLMGWMVYHPHDSRKSEPGFPDLTMARGHKTDDGVESRLVFAELKVSEGKADHLSNQSRVA